MYRRKVYLLFAFVFLTQLGIAQKAPLATLDSLAGRFIAELRNTSAEKFQIFTNKQVYAVGEIVWFKAFVQDLVSKRLTGKSNILFVDMVDANDHIVNQCMLHAAAFKTDGSFMLPDTLASGHYWLRAYTASSVAGKEPVIGIQPIYLINSLKPDPEKSSNLKAMNMAQESFKDSLLVNIHPEGGTVIGGATTLLAIKVTKMNGIPFSGSGFIKDNRDSIVARFTTNSAGLAKASFFCFSYSQYKVHMVNAGKPDLVYNVPPVNMFAAQLGLLENNGIRKLRIVLEDSLYRRDKLTFLLGISGDSLCFSSFGKGSYEVVLPEYRFPKGIAQFFLFDEERSLLSKRSLFIEGNEPLIKLVTEKQKYTAREKVNLSLEITGANQKTIPASFSITVEDRAKEVVLQNPGLSKEAIFTSLAAADKDLYLLTDYKSLGDEIILKIKLPKHWEEQPKEDSSLYIKGRVIDGRGRPLVKKIVTLFGDMKSKLFVSDTTDEKGAFNFPLIAYYDQTKFNLQVTEPSGILIPSKIQLDTMLKIPAIKTPAHLKQYFEWEDITAVRKKLVLQIANDTILQRRGKEWLTDVTVRGYVKKDPGYDVKKRMSLFSKVIPADLLQRAGNGSLGNAIFRAPGIHLRNGYVTVTGGNSFGTGPQTEPLLVVDGVPIPSDTLDKLSGSEPSPLLMALNRIDPATVDFIEVLTGSESAMFGTRGGNGVIIVNTRSTMLFDDPTKNNGMRNFLVKGFQVPEKFDHPDYAIKENRLSKIPDNRTHIYWYGDGVTDELGKSALSFYTADGSATYSIIVQGITAEGFVFRKEIMIDRK